MQEGIAELQDLFSLDLDSLIIVARHYKWNQDKMHAWFSEQDSLVCRLGLEFDSKAATPEMGASLPEMHGGYCPICYEKIDEGNSFALACKHTFCNECWKEYLTTKVESGPEGVNSLCQQAGCNMRVPHSTFLSQLEDSPGVKETYWKWLCKNYTDDNKNVKWCPNPKCDVCCERSDLSVNVVEVECKCGTDFCFKCGELAHKPIDCEEAKHWIAKETDESENTLWLKANTKNCPKCEHPIEKNQGCNVMQCLSCKHDFCWLCLVDWRLH
mmetsp:Transcript_1826/g.2594  ORF Transcript_1826/g.2594 Transcript_1826/m.2594 type:complete len:270 (-) Transcript_1826:673-1482(-)